MTTDNHKSTEKDKTTSEKPKEKMFKPGQGFHTATLWQRFTFGWVKPFHDLTEKDDQIQFDQLNEDPTLDKIMLAEQQKVFEEVYFSQQQKNKTGYFPIIYAIFWTFRWTFAQLILFNAVIACYDFFNPYWDKMSIEYIENFDSEPDAPTYFGVTQFGYTLLFGKMIQGFFEHCTHEQRWFRFDTIRGYSCYLVQAMLQEKTLKVSAAGKDIAEGQMESLTHRASVWRIPIMFIDGMGVLSMIFSCYYYFQTEFGTLFLLFAIAQLAVTWLTVKYINKQMGDHKAIHEAREKHNTYLTEMVNSIKMIKLFGWEQIFANRITDQRDLAKHHELKRKGMEQVQHWFNKISHHIFPVIIYSVYIYMGNSISLSMIIISRDYFGRMNHLRHAIPNLYRNFRELSQEFEKIDEFMRQPDRQSNIRELPSKSMDSNTSIKVCGNFSWGFAHRKDSKEKAALQDYIDLKNIDIEIKKGEFICVVGNVGSGKSNLLNAINGELVYVPEELNVNSTDEHEKEWFEKFQNEVFEHQIKDAPIKISNKVSFVEPKSWIWNGKLRDIILFGEIFEEERYWATIKACQLESDLKILPNSDQTEIGEMGVNLSGGQKARVSLARAVYANRDIILMDDPISALDANVRKQIFKQVFAGVCHDKTRILVTHSVDFLDLCDRIIVMEQGKIDAVGTFDSLQDNKHLSQILKAYNDQKQMTLACASKGQDQEASTEETSSDEKKEISDENTEKGKLMKKEDEIELPDAEFKDLFKAVKYIGGYKVAAFIFVLTMTMTLIGHYMGQIERFWAIQTPEEQQEKFWENIYLIVGVTCVHCLLETISTLVNDKLLDGTRKNFYDMMMERITHAPINLYFDVTPVSRIMKHFHEDIHAFDHEFVHAAFRTLENILFVGFSVYIILITVPALALMIPFVIYRKKRQQDQERKMYPNMEKLGRAAHEPCSKVRKANFNGLSVIRAFGKQEERFEMYKNELIKSNVQWDRMSTSIHKNCGFSNCLDWLTMYGMCLFGAYSARGAGQAITLMIMIDYTMQLEWRTNYLRDIQQRQKEKIQKVQKLIDFESMVQEVDDEKVKVDEQWPAKGKVSFNQVFLRYRPTTDQVLKNLSFDIQPGNKVGIVGRTGAGKSTIALTLSRILELEGGSIEIDGVNIRDIGLKNLRSKITMIPQDPVLFKGTLGFNIDPTQKLPKEQLERVIEKSGLKDLLSKEKDVKENILEQEINESGGNLSSGEKQLISICRAVLRKAKVVVLDEATSNIDVITEQKILNLMNEELADSTVITIAHRLNTIIKSDKVLVLGEGSLLEYDTPQNLVKRPGSHFANLLSELKKKE